MDLFNHEKKKFRSNILLEIQNNKMNAIICDFGLARISSEANVLIFFLYFHSFLSFSFLYIQIIF